jgi:hypothetical protein
MSNDDIDAIRVEAVYAFMAWMVGRVSVSGPFSANHPVAPGAALVVEFCQRQGWKVPEKDGINPLPLENGNTDYTV